MKIERRSPTRYVVEFHAYELAQLMAAARWALEAGGEGLPPSSAEGLRRLMAGYEQQLGRIGAEPDRGETSRAGDLRPLAPAGPDSAGAGQHDVGRRPA